MAERTIGIETELAFAATGQRGQSLDQKALLQGLLVEAVRGIPHLPAVNGNGFFTGNGAKMYLDAGNHPEACSPEVDSPTEVVRYLMAGDEIWRQFMSAATSSLPAGATACLYKCNVDYSQNLTTWACHENYGHRADPALLPRQLIPFLVSRLYTGAGGLDPFHPGITFCFSPRVCHLSQVESSSSTGNRGIFHTKDEPLAASGWHRLHVLCGDSVCSHLSNWLKIGTTGLVVALCEAKLNPGEDVQLKNPLEAMRAFNTDLAFEHRVRTTNDRELTALDIQRHYLQFAERHLDHPSMPAWAAEVCFGWRQMLKRLERGPGEVQLALDYAMKWALFRAHCQSNGFDPDQIRIWNWIIDALDPAGKIVCLPIDQVMQQITSPIGTLHVDADRLSPYLEHAGFFWDDLPRFWKLRQELCEIDVRFGQVWPDGIFRRLDERGILRHSLPDLTRKEILKAVSEPPNQGRARLRGEFIRAHNGKNGYYCDWHLIHDNHGKALYLTNPFQEHLPEWADYASTMS